MAQAGADPQLVSTVPAVSAPVDIDPAVLAGNISSVSQSVLGSTKHVAPRAMSKAMRAIDRQHPDPPPDDDPLPPNDGVSPPPPQEVIEDTADLVVVIYDITVECLETDLCL